MFSRGGCRSGARRRPRTTQAVRPNTLRPDASFCVCKDKTMNARLDLLAIPTAQRDLTATAPMICCPRSSAAADDAPELFAMLVMALERMGSWFIRLLCPAVFSAGRTRE